MLMRLMGTRVRRGLAYVNLVRPESKGKVVYMINNGTLKEQLGRNVKFYGGPK